MSEYAEMNGQINLAAAKDACSQPPFTDHITTADFNNHCRSFLYEDWQGEWMATVDNKLRCVKPSILQWKFNSFSSRRDEVVICRLRLGHTRATHGYLMESGAAPLCNRCNCRLSVHHILMECVCYAALRRKFKFPGRISVLLGDDAKRLTYVLSYLKAIRMYSSI